MEETKTIASDELLMEQLENRDWDAFWLRLMGRCAWLLRKRYHKKWPDDKLKDFSRKAVGEIINKVFVNKKRKWYIDSYPDFEKFIVSALDSHVNNTLNNVEAEINIGDNEFLLNGNGQVNSSPQDVVITKELREQIFDELQNAGATDDELLIFECLADGIEKPEDIRTETGLSEEEFHNAWRRFKRKREVIKQNLAAHGY